MADRRRLREHAIRLAVPGAAFVITSAALLAIWAAQLDDLLPWWVLGIALAAGLVLLLGAMAVGLLIGQRLVGDRIEIALRETGGRWRHGRAEMQGRTMTFLPYVWQVRVPTGEQEHVNVLSIDTQLERRPRVRELWALNFQARVVAVVTTDGPVEMAALPSQLDRIARAVGAPNR